MSRLAGTAAEEGWLVYRVARGRALVAGWPDLLCVRDGRVLVFEAKTQTGRVTPEQREWLTALDGVPGVAAFVVRPHPPTRPDAVKHPTLGAGEAVRYLRSPRRTAAQTGDGDEDGAAFPEVLARLAAEERAAAAAAAGDNEPI